MPLKEPVERSIQKTYIGAIAAHDHIPGAQARVGGEQEQPMPFGKRKQGCQPVMSSAACPVQHHHQWRWRIGFRGSRHIAQSVALAIQLKWMQASRERGLAWRGGPGQQVAGPFGIIMLHFPPIERHPLVLLSIFPHSLYGAVVKKVSTSP